jgi:hypothetical protein
LRLRKTGWWLECVIAIRRSRLFFCFYLFFRNSQKRISKWDVLSRII